MMLLALYPMEALFFMQTTFSSTTQLRTLKTTKHYRMTVSVWITASHLSLNVANCCQTISRKKKTPIYPTSPLCINGATIDRADIFKYLGVSISSNLSWSPNMDARKPEVWLPFCTGVSMDMLIVVHYSSCIRP